MALDGMFERMERFRAFTMAHPRLMTARDELVDAIEGATPGSLVLVIGPTGVGKTTLRLKVEHLLLQQMTPQMADDPSRLPFVSVDVPPPHSGRFRWRDYFGRLLLAMNEPLIHSKTCRGSAGSPMPVAAIPGDTELSYAAEQALRYCTRPKNSLIQTTTFRLEVVSAI